MAQSRDKRRQRRTAKSPTAVRPVADHRRRTVRRVAVVLMILIGLAGILIVTSPGSTDEPAGRAPVG